MKHQHAILTPLESNCASDSTPLPVSNRVISIRQNPAFSCYSSSIRDNISVGRSVYNEFQNCKQVLQCQVDNLDNLDDVHNVDDVDNMDDFDNVDIRYKIVVDNISNVNDDIDDVDKIEDIDDVDNVDDV